MRFKTHFKVSFVSFPTQHITSNPEMQNSGCAESILLLLVLKTTQRMTVRRQSG